MTPLPYGGAMSDDADRAVETAEAVAEAVRSLNHLTISPGDLDPGDLYRIVGSISTALGRLPQLLDQIARTLNDLEERGVLRDDGARQFLDGHFAEALAPLALAAGAAGDAGRALDGAAQVLSHLYVDNRA